MNPQSNQHLHPHFSGFTFIPVILAALIFYTVYTSVLVPNQNNSMVQGTRETKENDPAITPTSPSLKTTDLPSSVDTRELPKAQKGWLTVRRTFEESTSDGSYDLYEDKGMVSTGRPYLDEGSCSISRQIQKLSAAVQSYSPQLQRCCEAWGDAS